MEFLPLITIPIIYFTVAFLRPKFCRTSWKPCAICVAVSGTWLILLVLWILSVPIPTTMLAILLGMSVSGLMYKMEPAYKAFRLKNFWFVRLVLILGGLYGASFLISQEWGGLLLVAISGLLAILIASLLFQGTTHENAVKSAAQTGLSASLMKKLDDCC